MKVHGFLNAVRQITIPWPFNKTSVQQKCFLPSLDTQISVRTGQTPMKWRESSTYPRLQRQLWSWQSYLVYRFCGKISILVFIITLMKLRFCAKHSREPRNWSQNLCTNYGIVLWIGYFSATLLHTVVRNMYIFALYILCSHQCKLWYVNVHFQTNFTSVREKYMG